MEARGREGRVREGERGGENEGRDEVEAEAKHWRGEFIGCGE